ncbi:hypothetical protein THAOC_21336 [Thalassiosira oceanica]|uniref:Uncharacterized protein n=1 Tax=Thalassiosira oceanica TaxID=159749 RepID=K0SC64_THAOC|nr:hypothetical protein THAOC_21336 [Thalassiosira oceanica]|eukprot:EJK58531.1 hypothetical protein THAOC_21336 [Thalassiosira oceanica]
MPLDVLGRTRIIAIINLERGIPSNRRSSICNDYVPALCTHRPSHLPIEWSGEDSGLWLSCLIVIRP